MEHSWSDNVVDYEGTWEPTVRDIDPTTLVRVDKYYQDSDLKDDFGGVEDNMLTGSMKCQIGLV